MLGRQPARACDRENSLSKLTHIDGHRRGHCRTLADKADPSAKPMPQGRIADW